MDKLIRRFDREKDADLCFCRARGVAYARDMSVDRMQYGDNYYDKVAAYQGSDIEQRVHLSRLSMLDKFMLKGEAVLDYGCGTGEFVRKLEQVGYRAKGFDPIPKVKQQLREAGTYSADIAAHGAVTMWDVIEHLENPHELLEQVQAGGMLFCSMPIFKSLDDVRASKHYRPGEHLYYFTEDGFVDWMAAHGFRLLHCSDVETELGRDSIEQFAFCKDLPAYQDYIEQYHLMHEAKYYGSSATELHLSSAAKAVRMFRPQSILDYGAGRSDLVAHFWRDGERRIQRYDPAIRKIRTLRRQDRFDMVLCCDVMEHIPINYVDTVLQQIKHHAPRAFFTISCKPARARLPNGENAHCTIMTPSEWMGWVKSYYRKVDRLACEWEHELVLAADDKQ